MIHRTILSATAVLLTLNGILLSSAGNAFRRKPAMDTRTAKAEEEEGDFKPLQELGATVNGVQFELVRRDKQHVDIVAHLKANTLTMPDQKVFQREKANITVYEPGQTSKGYDYHLSADHNWLFVDRGIFHRYAVGYLYHRVSLTQMANVLPGGDSFSDAALRYYCKVRRKSFFKLGGASRNIAFKGWQGKDRIAFWMFAASDWNDGRNKGEISAACYMSYNLKNRTFQIIKEYNK